MKNLIKLMVMLIPVWALSGCIMAVNNVNKGYQFPVEKNEGVLLASITQAGFGARTAISSTYYFRNIETGKKHRISISPSLLPGLGSNSDFSSDYGKVVAVSLPAGSYEFNSWRASNNQVALTPGYLLPVGFTIEKGKSTYVGNIYAQMRSMKNLFGISVLGDVEVFFLDKLQRDLPVITSLYPFVNNQNLTVKIAREGAWPIDVERLKANQAQ